MKQIRLEVSNEAFAVLTEMARRGRMHPQTIARYCVEDSLAQAIDQSLCRDGDTILIESAREGEKACERAWTEASEYPGTYGVVLEQAAKETTPAIPKDGLKVKLKNGFDLYRVNASCRKACDPIAKKFGLTVERFLAKYSRGTLPGQLRGVRFEDQSTRPPKGFSISFGDDDRIQERVTRAAQFAGKSLKSFVWMVVAGSVTTYEDDMILDPKDSQNPIGDEIVIREFQIRQERYEIAA